MSEIKIDGQNVIGAQCWCGDDLVVAPNYIHLLHKEDNPNDELIVCCKDFSHASFFFNCLFKGNQPKESTE